jgi:hypothetical protein
MENYKDMGLLHQILFKIYKLDTAIACFRKEDDKIFAETSIFNMTFFYLKQISGLCNKISSDFRSENSSLPWNDYIDFSNRYDYGDSLVEPTTEMREIMSYLTNQTFVLAKFCTDVLTAYSDSNIGDPDFPPFNRNFFKAYL